MPKNVRKRFLTLIEMMIVMFIIATITGVLGYRYQGSLDDAKVFKTKTAMERLSTALSLAAAENPDFLGNIQSEWQNAAVNSSMGTKNPNDIIRDGWGQLFEVSVENGNIVIHSPSYEQYVRNNPTKFAKNAAY